MAERGTWGRMNWENTQASAHNTRYNYYNGEQAAAAAAATDRNSNDRQKQQQQQQQKQLEYLEDWSQWDYCNNIRLCVELLNKFNRIKMSNKIKLLSMEDMFSSKSCESVYYA